jgi:thiosulfate/3-mercaptopyruvate sulfurtransferase
VTLCRGGGTSAAVVAHALTAVGQEDVTIYDGSLEEWSADPLLPLVLGPHQYDLSFH